MLTAPGLDRVAPLLDGTRDLGTILGELEIAGAAQQGAALLGRLHADGHLVTRAAPPERDPELALWEALGMDPNVAARQLATGKVQVLSLGASAVECWHGALRAMGVQVTQDEADAELVVVLTEDYLDPELAAIDRRLRRRRTPWVLCRPVGRSLWMGPWFETDGPCWTCLADRLRAHDVRAGILPDGQAGELVRFGGVVRHHGWSALGAHLLAMDVARRVVGGGSQHPATLQVWDIAALNPAQHVVHRLPHCPSCGDPGLRSARVHCRPELNDPVVRPDRGACERPASAEETWDQYAALVSPLTGIVPAVEPDPDAPAGVESVRSGINLAVGAGEGATASMRWSCGGKGRTRQHARTGALCEALERYSGVRFGGEVTIRATWEDVAKEAVHPDEMQLFAPEQYADRESWNAAHADLQWIPERFDPAELTDWTRAWSLHDDSSRLVATDLLFYSPGTRALRADSNGAAAGATTADAVLQGLLEVVERDAVAIWWYNRLRMPQIDLDTADVDGLDEARSTHVALGRHLWALDVTSDVGVPCTVALSRRTDGDRDDVVLGFGAHPDPRVALSRAIGEVGQMLPTMLRLQRTSLAGADPDLERWCRQIAVGDEPWLRGDGVTSVPSIAPGTLAQRRRDVLDRLKQTGLSAYVVDQTRPDVGLAVVKVVVPGARHFWCRLAPGRLFEVPVRTGHLQAPTPYADLNPHPVFL